MGLYPATIGRILASPRNLRYAAEISSTGNAASFECGAAVSVALTITEPEKLVADAAFGSSGCGFMIAAADLLLSAVRGKRLMELRGLRPDELKRNVEAVLGQAPSERARCIAAAVEALQNAFAAYRTASLAEFAGEEAIICTCFGIGERAIERVIEGKLASTVEEVADECSAGSGCGSCRMLIQEILDTQLRMPS